VRNNIRKQHTTRMLFKNVCYAVVCSMLYISV